MMQGPSDAYKLMTAPQTDGFTREPALTMLAAERVAADSTKVSAPIGVPTVL